MMAVIWFGSALFVAGITLSSFIKYMTAGEYVVAMFPLVIMIINVIIAGMCYGAIRKMVVR